MSQMAGIVIGGGQSNFAGWVDEAELVEEFVAVADFRGEELASGLLTVVTMVTIVFEHGTAAGDVDDDGIDAAGVESCGVFVGHFACGGAAAGVEMDRTATGLILRNDDVASILLEDAGGGPIGLAKECIADAAGEEGDTGAAAAFGGDEFRQCGQGLLERREHRREAAEAGWE